MTDFTTSPDPRPVHDIDLAQVFAVLRRHWLPLLLAPLLLGGATYGLFSAQAPTFEATTSLMAAPPDNSNSVLSSASVTASQLPQGAVDEVVHSRGAVTRMVALVNASDLPAATQASIAADLREELADGTFGRVAVRSRLDPQQRGVYELRARGESPEAAQVLATSAAQALLEWDIQRARQGVSRARRNLQEQLDNLNVRLAATAPGSAEQQSLVAARGQLLLDLSQATVFEEGALGNLTLLAEANAPRRPVSPKPARNAALVALITFFAGAALTLLLDSLRRKVRSTADVIGLGIPVLGELPRLTRSRRTQAVAEARNGELYEPAGFLRVNLSSADAPPHALIAVTSARPAEGKSTVVATTAAAFAQANKRVLIIDLDLHRPMQQEFWAIGSRAWVALPGAVELHQTTVVQALDHPEQASAVDMGEGVHLLPAGEVGRRAAGLLSNEHLPALLRRWAQAYDVVLIDTPPVLSVADALVIARHTDGLVLVVESDGTSVPEVQRVLRDVRTAGVSLLGVVMNKVRRGQQGYYAYAYGSRKAESR